MAESLREGDLSVSCALSEGAGVAVMEATASGLPVVLSDQPAYHQWVEEGVHGSFFPPGSCSDLADRLKEIASDLERTRFMSIASLKRAEKHFNWDDNYAKLSELHARLIRDAR